MKETRTRYTYVFMYIYKSGKLFTSNIFIWKEWVIRGTDLYDTFLLKSTSLVFSFSLPAKYRYTDVFYDPCAKCI